jgi:hypothetical protein
MNSQIEGWRVQQYAANVYQLSQQRGSRLSGAVRRESFTGKAEFFDRLGLASAVDKTGRNEDTPNLDIAHSRRMLTTVTRHWGTLVDRKDKLQNIHNPENEYAVAAQNALGRKIDSIVVDALLGTAYYGETGTSSQTLGTAQQIAPVSAAAIDYLNVNALLQAKKILDAAEAVGPRYLILGSDQLMRLLMTTQATSSDYNTVRALVNGELDTFVGFKFIRSEVLGALTASSTSGQGSYDADDFHFSTSTGLYSGGGTDLVGTEKMAIAFVGDGLILGENTGGRKADITERPDKGYSMQVYAAMDFGAVRMEEAKVVQIFCKA